MVSFDEDNAADDSVMHLNIDVVELFERSLSRLGQVQQIEDILQDWMTDDE